MKLGEQLKLIGRRAQHDAIEAVRCEAVRLIACEVHRQLAAERERNEIIERRAKIGDDAAGDQTREAVAEPVSRVVGDRAPTATSEIMDVTAGETAPFADDPALAAALDRVKAKHAGDPEPIADPDLDRPAPADDAPPVSLLEEIEAFLLQFDMAATRFGALANKELSLVASLRKGRKPGRLLADRIRQFMREYPRKHPVAPAEIPTADDASGCEGSAPEGSRDATGVLKHTVANADQSRVLSKKGDVLEIDLTAAPSRMDSRYANGVRVPIEAAAAKFSGLATGAWDDDFAARAASAAERAAGARACRRCGIAAIPQYVTTCIESACPGRVTA